MHRPGWKTVLAKREKGNVLVPIFAWRTLGHDGEEGSWQAFVFLCAIPCMAPAKTILRIVFVSCSCNPHSTFKMTDKSESSKMPWRRPQNKVRPPIIFAIETSPCQDVQWQCQCPRILNFDCEQLSCCVRRHCVLDNERQTRLPHHLLHPS